MSNMLAGVLVLAIIASISLTGSFFSGLLIGISIWAGIWAITMDRES